VVTPAEALQAVFMHMKEAGGDVSGGRRIRKPAAKAKAGRNAKAKPTAKAAGRTAEPAMDLAVGRRIRDLRHERKLSLETIAERTALSIGFLSQIERGLSSPSLRVLATLADVLGVGIAALFGSRLGDSAPDGVVTRRKQRAELKLWRSGISKQLLSPAGTESRLNLFLVYLKPGGNTGDELYTHDGEEAGLVLEGEMSLTVDAETWSLKTGDSFRFASRRPHRFSNPSEDANAVVLWVNCVAAVS
jgi:transcriptional regulator with XRE-family HTH domain